jgi:hypothetical protein
LDLVFFEAVTSYFPVTGWLVIFHRSGFRLSEVAITASSVLGIETPGSIGGILTHVEDSPFLQEREMLRQRTFFEEYSFSSYLVQDYQTIFLNNLILSKKIALVLHPTF